VLFHKKKSEQGDLTSSPINIKLEEVDKFGQCHPKIGLLILTLVCPKFTASNNVLKSLQMSCELIVKKEKYLRRAFVKFEQIIRRFGQMFIN
jgi:hypothetical protein